MAKILISGGSGLLGKAISERLLNEGHTPVWLSREGGQEKGIKKFKWDINRNFIDPGAFEGVEHVIHLAGAGVMEKRWTKKYKEEILNSRIKSARLLIGQVSANSSIKSFVGGSATGYYGSTQSDKSFNENDGPGSDFLADVCRKWEDSYNALLQLNLRTVIIRTGVVLAKNGGAYPKMAAPAKRGLAAVFGDGRQFFPWIHLNDIAGIFVESVFNKEMRGVYNGVASELITNSEFTLQLAASLHKKVLLPALPDLLLKLALGERAVTLTGSQKIENKKIKDAGYQFEFDKVRNALDDLAK